MPRLKAIETQSAEPQVKALLETVQKKMGVTPNMMRAMANAPAVLEAYLGFSGGLGKSALSPKLREQIALIVSELNECRYCLSAHTALGKMVGLGDEEVADSRRGVSPDRKTEAVLRFAGQVVSKQGRVSDEDVASVRAAGTSDGEIAEIVAVVSLNIFTNYFDHMAELDLDFPEVEAPGGVPACACH